MIGRGGRRRRRPAAHGALALATVLGLLPARPATAQAWDWQHGARAQIESNSNPALRAEAAEAVSTLTLSGQATARRATGTQATQADLALRLADADHGGPTATGSLDLRHALDRERDHAEARLSWQHERPREAPRTAQDLALGAATRSTATATLDWAHDVDERWTLQARALHAVTRHGAAASASDHSVDTTSASLRLRPSPTRAAWAALGQTRQRPSAGGAPTTVQSLQFGLSTAWSETLTLELAAGTARTARERVSASIVCPLPVAWCEAGLVPYQLSLAVVPERRRDSQYDGTWTQHLDEATTLRLSLGRRFTPGALGLSRDESRGLVLERSFSEALQASLRHEGVRSQDALAAGATSASLDTWTLALSRRVGRQWTLAASLGHRRLRPGPPQMGAEARLFSLTLQFDGDKRVGGP